MLAHCRTKLDRGLIKFSLFMSARLQWKSQSTGAQWNKSLLQTGTNYWFYGKLVLACIIITIIIIIVKLVSFSSFGLFFFYTSLRTVSLLPVWCQESLFATNLFQQKHSPPTWTSMNPSPWRPSVHGETAAILGFTFSFTCCEGNNNKARNQDGCWEN